MAEVAAVVPPTTPLATLASTSMARAGGSAPKVTRGSPTCGKARPKGKAHRAKPARRQINRWKDDVVVCPVCLAHPWDRGRSSNCREHIARHACPVLLTKMFMVDTSDRGSVPRAAMWTHPDGKTTVASFAPGTGRRSRRVYWSPETFSTADAAEVRWRSVVLLSQLDDGADGAVVMDDRAVAIAREHPLWCLEGSGEHTNVDGTVPDDRVTWPAGVALDDSHLWDDFEGLPSPEILGFDEVADPAVDDPAVRLDDDGWPGLEIDGIGIIPGLPMRWDSAGLTPIIGLPPAPSIGAAGPCPLPLPLGCDDKTFFDDRLPAR